MPSDLDTPEPGSDLSTKRGDINPAVAVKGEAAVKRAAKKAVGLNGVRGRWEDFGDMFRFTPYGACVTLFVNYYYY